MGSGVPVGDTPPRGPVFQDAVRWVIDQAEGGAKLVNDLGGLTKFGISQRCLSPETRVLHADLTWPRVADLKVGDELIGFHPAPGDHGQVLAPSKVLAVGPVRLPSSKVQTLKGSVIASNEHMWWACTPKGKNKNGRGYRWLMTSELRPEDFIAFYRSPWSTDTSCEGAYLAGIFDGEGHISQGTACISQNAGVVLDRVVSLLRQRGVKFSLAQKTGPRDHGCEVRTYSEDAMRLIGEVRPVRLLPKARGFWEGRFSHGKTTTPAVIECVQPVGEMDLIGLHTSTGTLIAEGFLSHNSFPTVDIRNLTREAAEAIYFESYWKAIKGNALPAALAFVTFDAAVNMGVATAVKLLQGAVRVVADGVMGPATVAAAKTCLPREYLVALVIAQRIAWYENLARTKPVYLEWLNGWRMRCVRLALEAGRWRSM